MKERVPHHSAFRRSQDKPQRYLALIQTRYYTHAKDMSHHPETDPLNTGLNKTLIQAADQCVMCGLCLPHCPTYTLERRETDSPRGRISLIRALATGQLPDDSPKLVEHLESCVLCRRCETVCPAEVPFGKMMDRARQKLFDDGRTRSALPYWLHLLVASRALRRLCVLLIRCGRYTGLQRLLHRTKLKPLSRLVHWAAIWPSEIASFKYSESARNQSVTLFTGCIAEMIDRETLLAASNLLRNAGVEVRIPAAQVCCGALHQHSGNRRYATVLTLQNTMAFSDTDIVVSCATGCGTQLREHQKKLGIDHFDILEFLSGYAERLNFKRLTDTLTERRIALHLPCTARDRSDPLPVLKSLLARLPDLKYQILPDTLSCCGAAGAYMLTHRKAAAALADKYLDLLEQLDIDILITLNVGCAAHFRQTAAARGLRLEVIHPVVLLNRQLHTETSPKGEQS